MVRRQQNRRRRFFESLEDRRMLALDSIDAVQAVISYGNLTINGDGQDDNFSVSGDGTPGDVVITGYTGTHGTNPTQIYESLNNTVMLGPANGSITLTGVTGSITINLGGGDVTLDVSDLNISGNLAISGTGGNDSVTVSGSTIGNNLSVTAGDGNDTVTIGDPAAATFGPTAGPIASSALSVGSNLSINLGNGNDSVLVGDPQADPYSNTNGLITSSTLTVGGNLTIAAGDGTDSILVQGAPEQTGLDYPYGGPVAVAKTGGLLTVGSSTLTVPSSATNVVATGSTTAATNDLDTYIPTPLTFVLSVKGNVSISVGDGDDTIDVGGFSPDDRAYPMIVGPGISEPVFVYSNNTFNIGGNLSITTGSGASYLFVGEEGCDLTVTGNFNLTAGNGANHIYIGAATPNITVDGNANITLGNGDNDFSEELMTVVGNEAITAGSGDNFIYIGFQSPDVPVVTIGGNLTIVAGNGTNSIGQISTRIGGNDTIGVGSGNNSIGVGGTPSQSLSMNTSNGTPTDDTEVVSVGGNVSIQLGAGTNSIGAGGLTVAGNIIVSRGTGFSSGGSLASQIEATTSISTTPRSHGSHPVGPVGLSYYTAGNLPTAADTITFVDVSAAQAGIYTGPADTDTVSITDSTFHDLGVALGSGAGSLTIGTTETTNSTTLVGLGTQNTYDDLGGNSFANLYTRGLTPPPISETTSIGSPATDPLTPPTTPGQPTSPASPGFNYIPPTPAPPVATTPPSTHTTFKPVSGAGLGGVFD